MSRRSLLALALVACGGDREEPPPAPRPVDAGALAPVIVAPHSGSIAMLAVTDDAGSVISIDENNDVRLWPTLDGTRQPVVVRARAAAEVAIADHDGGFLVALLDAANGGELLRLAPDGALRGRQVLPAEPGFVELASGADVVLARRADQAIVRFDTPALLEPAPGETILALAMRRRTAYAAIADRDRPAEIAAVREISMVRGLSWGESFTLPVPLAPPIAVSPSGKRIAGLSARTGTAIVIELASTPRAIASDVTGSNPDDHVLGFLDDDRAVFRGGIVVFAPQISAAFDPWAVSPRSQHRARGSRGAVVGDGVVVGGHATHLMLADEKRVRFLGYRDVGPGMLRVTGTQITLAYHHRLRWLDDALASPRAYEVPNDAAGGIAVDDHRVLKATYNPLHADRNQLDIALRDVTTGHEQLLASWAQGSNLAYDPSTQVFAVSGYTSTVARWKLDLATGKATKLRPLKALAGAQVQLFDPAVADGIVAVVHKYEQYGAKLEWFVDDGGARALPRSSAFELADMAHAIGFDRTGTFYALGAGGSETKQRPLHVVRSGAVLSKVMVDDTASGGTVDAEGARFALFSSSHLFLLDRAGIERWRIPVWGATTAAFSADGKTLLVGTQGGVLALDAATSTRRAAGCAWELALSESEPPMAIFLTPVVCAEGS